MPVSKQQSESSESEQNNQDDTLPYEQPKQDEDFNNISETEDNTGVKQEIKTSKPGPASFDAIKG